MKVVFLSLFFLVSCSHLAGESEQTISSLVTIFELEDFEDEEILSLERTMDYEFYLRLRRDNEEDKLKKVSAKLAKSWEKEFAQDYIQWSVEKRATPCEASYRLSLHGDELSLCEKEDQKAQEVNAFYQKILQELLD